MPSSHAQPARLMWQFVPIAAALLAQFAAGVAVEDAQRGGHRSQHVHSEDSHGSVSSVFRHEAGVHRPVRWGRPEEDAVLEAVRKHLGSTDDDELDDSVSEDDSVSDDLEGSREGDQANDEVATATAPPQLPPPSPTQSPDDPTWGRRRRSRRRRTRRRRRSRRRRRTRRRRTRRRQVSYNGWICAGVDIVPEWCKRNPLKDGYEYIPQLNGDQGMCPPCNCCKRKAPTTTTTTTTQTAVYEPPVNETRSGARRGHTVSLEVASAAVFLITVGVFS